MDRRTFNKLAAVMTAGLWSGTVELQAEADVDRSAPERWSLWRCAPIPFPDFISPLLPEAVAGAAIDFGKSGADLTVVLPDKPGADYNARALAAMVRLIHAKAPRSTVVRASDLTPAQRSGHLLVLGTPDTNSFARDLINNSVEAFLAGTGAGGYHLRAVSNPADSRRMVILALGADSSGAWPVAAILAYSLHPDRKGLTELHPWPVTLPAGTYWAPFEARYSPVAARREVSAPAVSPPTAPRIPFGVRIWGSPMPTLDSFRRLILALKAANINTVAIQSGGWPDLPNAPEVFESAIDIAWREGIFTILYAGNDLVSHKPAPLSDAHKAIVLAVRDHPGLLQWHLYNQLSADLTPEQHRMLDEQIRWLKSVSSKPVGVEVVWGHDRADIPPEKLQLIQDMKATGMSVVANDDAPVGGWSKRHDLSIWEPRLLQLRRCGLPMQAVLQAHIPFVDPTLPSAVEVRNQFWWAAAGGAQAFLFETAYLFTDLSMRGILSWDLRPLPDGRYDEIRRLAGSAREMEVVLADTQPEPEDAAEQLGIKLDHPDRAALRIRRGVSGQLHLLLINRSTEAAANIKVSLPASGLNTVELSPGGSLRNSQGNVLEIQIAPGDGACLRLSAPRSFIGVPLSPGAEGSSISRAIHREGIPFLEGQLAYDGHGVGKVDLRGGATLKHIYLLGMVNSGKSRAWSDPRNASKHFFLGDELGKIRVDYEDGSEQIFPLILGESIWWGELFAQNPNPFPTSAPFREAVAASLRLYPPGPVPDGNYVAVITPRQVPVRSIRVEDSPAKEGGPVLTGLTCETNQTARIPGATSLAEGTTSSEFTSFIEQKPLRSLGVGEPEAEAKLQDLRRALYTSDDQFHGSVPRNLPPFYTGPRISFTGNIFAGVLTNAFHHNLRDMLSKIGSDGTYHTSTLNSTSWGGYNGFGTYRENAGPYYTQAYSRDLGRSLQEITALGGLDVAGRCADFCLESARIWEEKPSLKIKSQDIPRHWGRIINRVGTAGCFENDGHGLICVFLFRLWQRLPNRESWLRPRWRDLAAAADWILWQFEHPDISQATDTLHTTGESASFGGYTVYADAVCMNALLGFAGMANSIGETGAAARWSARAAQMKQAIASRYIVDDPKYGRVWTLDSAGWTHKSTVLGPLIFLADSHGFAPQDDDSTWRAASLAAFQRILDTYQPHGFYGQAMGYGQGFITQSALLLDRMKDATTMLEWTAKQIYDPRVGSFIVPEGCEIDPTGRLWYRVGDLGNGVQEAEIVKTLRIVLGVDDTRPERLQFFPRMPYGWSEMAVEAYPIVFQHAGKLDTARLMFKLERVGDSMTLAVSADKDLGKVTTRLGPFPQQPSASIVRVNGRPQKATPEQSGDSWWLSFTMTVGPTVQQRIPTS